MARSMTTRVGIPLTLNLLERAERLGEPNGIAPVNAVISLKYSRKDELSRSEVAKKIVALFFDAFFATQSFSVGVKPRQGGHQ